MDLFLFPSERIGHAGDKIQGNQHEVKELTAFLLVLKCECHCL